MAYPSNISLYRANYDTSDYDAGRIVEESILSYANLFFPYFQNNNDITIDISNDSNTSNLLSDELFFGFKEATHVSKRTNSLSNAFCFGEQTLSFYIAKKTPITGYIEDTKIYCKTYLTISITDIIRGTTTNLCTFTDFSKKTDDTSRYCSYTVPLDHVPSFQSYNLFGLFVLNIKVENEFYTDKELKTKYVYHNGTFSNHNLQLLTFSASKEAIDVIPDISPIFTDQVLTTDTFIDLYNKSIFPSIDSTTLTNDQKQSIIADQIATLFISQHPVITGDYYPSKIIGLGGEKGIRANKSKNLLDINYGEKYEAITLAKNRLFNIAVNYKAYNLIKDIEKEFSTYDRSSQLVRDPARIMLLNEDGTLDNTFGVNGIIFNPFSLYTSNIELLTESDPQIIQLDLFNNSVDITNINATRYNDTILQNNDTIIKVSFDVTYGEEKISRIRYSLITHNNLTMDEFIDETGLTTSHVFNLYSFGGVQYSSTESDIVKVRIDIEDINGYVNMFYGNVICPNDYTYAGIVEISAMQSNDGSGNIIVDYLYQGTSAVDLGDITLQYSLNNSTWTDVIFEDGSESGDDIEAIGDIGNGILPGWKRIVWNPSILTTQTEVYIKLLVDNIDETTKEIVQNSSNIVVVDRVIPQLYIRKLSENDIIPSTSSESS